MKRKVAAFLLCVALASLCALPACQNNANTGSIGGSIPAAPGGAEPANELVIYYADQAQLLTDGLEEYRARYPDVEVRVEYFRVYNWRSVYAEDVGSIKELYQDSNVAEAYTRRVTTELMAGEGPDVLFLDTTFFNDIHKLAASGSLLDLSPYFEADQSFDEEAYYAPVFNLGVMGGKRLFVPEVFRIPAAVGAKEVLEAAGMNPARVTGLVPLLEEVAKALPALGQNPDFAGVFRKSSTDSSLFDQFISLAAASAVDVEAGEALPDAASLRAFFAAVKPFYRYTRQMPESAVSWWGGLGLFDVYPDILYLEAPMDDMTTFWDELYRPLPGPSVPMAQAEPAPDPAPEPKPRFIFEKGLAPAAGLTPLVIPLASLGGELQAVVDKAMAVPAGAKNPQNACNFIRVMLETRQNTIGNSHTGYEAVNKRTNLIHVNNSGLGEVLRSGEGLTATRLTGAVLVNPALTEILMTCMTPFLNDEQSYGSCEARLRERLEIYLSE